MRNLNHPAPRQPLLACRAGYTAVGLKARY